MCRDSSETGLGALASFFLILGIILIYSSRGTVQFSVSTLTGSTILLNDVIDVSKPVKFYGYGGTIYRCTTKPSLRSPPETWTTWMTKLTPIDGHSKLSFPLYLNPSSVVRMKLTSFSGTYLIFDSEQEFTKWDNGEPNLPVFQCTGDDCDFPVTHTTRPSTLEHHFSFTNPEASRAMMLMEVSFRLTSHNVGTSSCNAYCHLGAESDECSVKARNFNKNHWVFQSPQHSASEMSVLLYDEPGSINWWMVLFGIISILVAIAVCAYRIITCDFC
ncbi:hypothetical protein RCL1_008294 [Eukaryota sp. TZLM3-RCL]